jgi:L-lactate dehydrogenase
MTDRYPEAALLDLATSLLRAAGLDEAKAHDTAQILVEGDLLGHTTHGLALLPPYLNELETGSMTKTGEPRVLADVPAAVTWDGMRLPGPWLTVRAIELAMERAAKLGTCTVVIRRSHHIACLAAYLQRVTERGMMIILSCSDPRMASIAPFGGRVPLYTPNPIAAAWPTDGDPVMLDVSMSITSNANVARHRSEKRALPQRWLLYADGNPTDDPAAVTTDPPGSVLPIGGLDHGHKGYALGLLVEAMTSGLSGHGRADPKEGWAANVFVQVFDPAMFGGAKDFLRQMTWLSNACHATPTREGFDQVRLPGERGLRRREAQLRDGVTLHESIMPSLQPWAERLKVEIPEAR